MKSRILIAICSSHKYEDRRRAVRKTWLQRLPRGMQAVFIVGKGQWLDEEDVVQLPVDDKFVRLPVKIQSFFRHALAHYDFDFLFKCDDDTYLHTERLLTLPVKGVEFIGSDCDNHRSVAQGGAGYLLSRRAVG